MVVELGPYPVLLFSSCINVQSVNRELRKSSFNSRDYNDDQAPLKSCSAVTAGKVKK